jgi:5-methylcytosine-specific restriction endonuclease McrA
MRLRPCLRCGALTASGSYCQRHQPIKARKGSTRQWRQTRERILHRDGYTCRRCGALAQHVDHIHPVARGGGDHESNLRALCAACNLAKGDR